MVETERFADREQGNPLTRCNALTLSLSLGCRDEKTDPTLDPHSASSTAKEGGAAQTATSNNPGDPQGDPGVSSGEKGAGAAGDKKGQGEPGSDLADRAETGDLRPEEFVLIVMENLSSYAPMRVNGPLPDAYVGRALKNRNTFKSDGKLVVDILDNADAGTIETKETITGVPQQLQLRETPPTVEEFTVGHKVIKFSSGKVEQFDAAGQLVSTSTDKFFTDPSGATWIYKTMGGADKGKDAWAIKGDIPSKLEGYALVFETDFRNPNKNLDVFDGGIYVKRDFSNNGVLTIRDKPDKFSLVVLGSAFQRNRAHITGKVHVGGNLKLVGEDDDFDEGDDESEGDDSGDSSSGGAGGSKPECPGNSCNSNAGGGGKPADPGSQGKGQGNDKPKKQTGASLATAPFAAIDGTLFVAGNLESMVDFLISNTALTQKIAETVLKTQFIPVESLEWVATASLLDPDGVTSAVAISVFRVPPEISLAPPMSRAVPRQAPGGAELTDGEIRALYRAAEGGDVAAYEALVGEEFLTVVAGNSMNYSPDLALYGGAKLVSGVNEIIMEFKTSGAQEVRLERAFFMPPSSVIGDFTVDARRINAVIYPLMDIGAYTIPQTSIASMMTQIAQFRADPEGRRLREMEWEEYKLIAEGKMPVPPRDPESELAPDRSVLPIQPRKQAGSTCAPGAFLPSRYVSSGCWLIGHDYSQDKPKPPWVFRQKDTKWSCGPTATSQLFYYWQDEKGKYCIETDVEALAQNMAMQMETNTDIEGRPTWPWNVDTGIQEAARDYGYDAAADVRESQPEEDVRSHIKNGRPALWNTLLEGNEEAGNWNPKIWHYRLIIGYDRVNRNWNTDKWYFYVIDNKSDHWGTLERVRASWWSAWGAGWSAVTVGEFVERNKYYYDEDRDGYGNAGTSAKFCDASPPRPSNGKGDDVGYWADNGDDCDDGDGLICPDTNKCRERCNTADDDCDGDVDEDFPDLGQECTAGIGECKRTGEKVCNAEQTGTVCNAVPGEPVPEVCDDKDNDCDGVKDEGVMVEAYKDRDGDGVGASDLIFWVCPPIPSGMSSSKGDCADHDAAIFPGNTEVCDYKDNDCDAGTQEVRLTLWRDVDGDGYGDPSFSVSSCGPPGDGWVSNPDDCSPGNASIHPGASETCNGTDDNCNGSIDEGVQTTYYRDADGDGFGNWWNSTASCSQPAGYVTNSADCDDSNAAIHPKCPAGYAYWYSNVCSRWPINQDCGDCGPDASYGTLTRLCQERGKKRCWYDSGSRTCQLRINDQCRSPKSDCNSTPTCPSVWPPPSWSQVSCDGDGVQCPWDDCGDNPGTRVCEKSFTYCAADGGTFWKDWGVCWKYVSCN